MQELLNSTFLMLSLTFVFGTILALASTYLRAEENETLVRVEELLGGSNCGACGQPGCHAFAQALLRSECVPSQCTVAEAEAVSAIASLLGVDPGESEKRIARLHCAGGISAVRVLAEYQGVSTCSAAAQTQHGGRSCSYGCMGLGDCDRACSFGAIRMNDQGLPVVDPERCTACGDCVKACPVNLFSLMPISQQLVVECSSPLTGEEARHSCAVACDACGRCASDAAPGVIQMLDGLPHIVAAAQATEACTHRCPTGAIKWVQGEQHDYHVPVNALRRHYA